MLFVTTSVQGLMYVVSETSCTVIKKQLFFLSVTVPTMGN